MPKQSIKTSIPNIPVYIAKPKRDFSRTIFNIKRTEKKPTMAAETAPVIIGAASMFPYNPVCPRASVSMANAPKMAGIDSRKEKRTAMSLDNPRKNPAASVAPEREMPGVMAMA